MTDVGKMTDDYLKTLESIGRQSSSPTPTVNTGTGSILASLLAHDAPATGISAGSWNTAAPASAPSQGFWSRLGDILSRPLFGINNAIAATEANVEKKGWLHGLTDFENNSPLPQVLQDAQNNPGAEKVAADRAAGHNALADFEDRGESPGNPGKALLEGLTGKLKGMPENYSQDWFKPDVDLPLYDEMQAQDTNPLAFHVNKKTASNPLKAVTNLALAIGTDPLSYINPVTPVAKGFNLLRDAAKPAEIALETAPAAKVAESVATGTPLAAAKPAIAETLAKEPDLWDMQRAKNDQLSLFDTTGKPAFDLPTAAKDASTSLEDAAQVHVANGVAKPPVVPQPIIEATDNLLNLVTPTHAPEIAKDVAAAVPGRVLNNAWQGRLTSKVVSQAAKEAPVGADRSAFMAERVTTQLKQEEDALAAQGIYPQIKSAPDATESYNLSYSDVLRDVPAVSAIQFGAKAATEAPAHSQVLAGAARALELHTSDLPLMEKQLSIRQAMTAAKTGSRAVDPKHLDVIAKQLADPSTATSLAAQEAINRSNVIVKDLQDTDTLTQHTITHVDSALSDPQIVPSAVARTMADISGPAKAEGAVIGASDSAITKAATNTAQHLVQAGSGSADVGAARMAVSNAADLSRSGHLAQPAMRARFIAQGSTIEKDADKVAAEAGIDISSLEDLSNRTYVRTQMGIMRYLNVVLNRMSGGYVPKLVDSLRRGDSIGQSATAANHAALDVISKRSTIDAQRKAWSAYIAGETPTDPEVLAVLNAGDKDPGLLAIANAIFDPVDSNFSTFARNGTPISEINKSMHAKGISKNFKFDESMPGKKDFEGQLNLFETPLSNQMSAWKTWAIDDPLNFVDRMYAAQMDLATKSTVARDFSRSFGSSVATNLRHFKIKPAPDSHFGAFLDPTRYYSADAVKEYFNLEKRVDAPKNFQGQSGPIASFVNGFLDPVMNVWKRYVTIVRPGHHIRNALTDVNSTMLDGFYTLTPYRKSFAMATTLGRFEDAGAAGMESLKLDKLPQGSDHLLTIKYKNGITKNYSVDQATALANSSGIYQTFVHGEDLGETAQHTNRVNGWLLNNKGIKLAGDVSQNLNHWMRGAHFAGLAERAKFTRQFATEDELAAAIGARVRQFHPDPTGLTPFETKNIRRIIPFYSFTRQAFPLVFEQVLSHPGRVMLLPKTTYAMAQATGIDPQSLTDQFPAGELYPSFISNNITGPVDLSGLPGGTSRETLNFGTNEEGILGAGGLNGNIGRNVLNMLNPVFKAPIDLTSGVNMGTGAHIVDKGEYIDSNLPIVNNVSALSGYSVAGSLSNLVSGNGDVPDPQRAVQKGEKATFFNQSVVNFLLGLGVQDATKPTYQRLALKGPNQ